MMYSVLLDKIKLPAFKTLVVISFFLFGCASVVASDLSFPGFSISVGEPGDGGQPLATGFKLLLLLTVLSIVPAFLVVMTSFTRIVIVLSMLRHALGMQQTPPNTVIISLSLFLTIFNMTPVFNEIYETAYLPLMEEKSTESAAFDNAAKSLTGFMVRHTREQDLMLMSDIAGIPTPQNVDEIKFHVLVPAFMLSELKAAFQIGFVIFLPFLLLDIIIAAILMSMGMLMVPPMMISLPIKVLMFVLIDGWNLVVSSLMNSFH